MDTRAIFEAYFRFVAEEGPTAFADYTQNVLWTPRATSALARVGLSMFPTGEVTAKGHKDHNQWSRCEYLNLDVTVGDPNSWGAPVFIAEHENSPFRARLQYDAWKLLSVEAKRRILVGYWGAGTEFGTFEAMCGAVKEVCADHPGKDILLIGGLYDARPKNIDEFRSAHQTFNIGVHKLA